MKTLSGRQEPETSPSLDDYATSRRIRRLYQRFFTGAYVGGSLRLLTLTTSDKARDEGKDIHRAFEALVKRVRRRWGRFEYIGVKEKKRDRVHLHLTFRGSYMEQVLLGEMWQKLYASPIVDIRKVAGARDCVQYLAKYLAKSPQGRYWASYNWVFAGWVGLSKRFRKLYGRYPLPFMLRTLARMTADMRSWTLWQLHPILMMDDT